jgi:uncharacterized protein YbaP (TraB family)
MLKTLLHKTLAALGLASIMGCATAPQQAPTARPALWQVADADTTIYLFGTIHMLPENYSWRTPAFDRVVNGSQSLVVETILDEANPQAVAGEVMRLGVRQGLPPIAQRVAPEKRPLLEAAIVKTGMPRSAFDVLETWAAAFMILGTQFHNLGVTAGAGVETVLKQNFKQAGKPIAQLESNTEQLSLFDTLPEKAQRDLLEGSIETPAEMRTQFNSMLAAWTRGDVGSISKTFNEDMAGSPDLQNALIRRRNHNWSQWVERRLATPGTTLVAVGAGHLAGPQSVVDLLQRKGYKVRRVQ